MAPLLSIVIPTRGRDEIAAKMIRLVATLAGPDAEIVVQDCTPSPTLPERLGKISTVQYEHTGRAVSMSENWERAISRVTGDYVSIIGDDDCVMPGITDAARWMAKQGMDALVQRVGPFLRYIWPDSANGQRSGETTIYRATGALTSLSPEAELRSSTQGVGDSIQRLPSAYYGIVSREAMQRMRARAGCYVDSLCPDYYLSFALASFVRSLVLIDYTLFLPGSCSARFTQDYDTRNQAHTAQYAFVDWPPLLPKSFVWEPVIAPSMLLALERTGRSELIPNIDFPKIYVKAMLGSAREAPAFLKQYLGVMRTIGQTRIAALARLTQAFAETGAVLARRRIARLNPWPIGDTTIVRRVKGVPDFETVIRLHQEYFREAGVVPPWETTAVFPTERAVGGGS